MKIRELGKNIVFNPYCELYHYESLSRGRDTEKKNRERFLEEKKLFLDRWQSVLDKGDPYYNPNLSLDDGYAIDVNKLREE